MEKQFGPDAPLGSLDLSNLAWAFRAESWHPIDYLLSLPKEQRKDKGFFWTVIEAYGEISETRWEHEWADWCLANWLIATAPADESETRNPAWGG